MTPDQQKKYAKIGSEIDLLKMTFELTQHQPDFERSLVDLRDHADHVKNLIYQLQTDITPPIYPHWHHLHPANQKKSDPMLLNKYYDAQIAEARKQQTDEDDVAPGGPHGSPDGRHDDPPLEVVGLDE